MSEDQSLLAPCPGTPNCVSSLARRERQRIEPLTFSGEPGQAMQCLREVIEAMPRARVVEFSTDHMQVVFTTRLMRFRDDVTLALDPAAAVIHVRSASRVGRSDFGANRKRVEAIRAAFLSGCARG